MMTAVPSAGPRSNPRWLAMTGTAESVGAVQVPADRGTAVAHLKAAPDAHCHREDEAVIRAGVGA
jgi:hypothetical protein